MIGMNKHLKLSLLIAGLPLVLSSCEYFIEKKVYCLDTSNDVGYVDGMCYQASRYDVVEAIFIINNPTNPEADPEDYTYDIVWNKNITVGDISFIGGLAGKKVTSVLKVTDQVIKINIEHHVDDQEATFGYIKVSQYSFKAISKRAREAYLYAYVAIGDKAGLVEKPESKKWKKSIMMP